MPPARYHHSKLPAVSEQLARSHRQVARIQRLLAQLAAGAEISVSTPAGRVLRSNSSWIAESPRSSLDGAVGCSPLAATPPARPSPLALTGPGRPAPAATRAGSGSAAAQMGRELIGGADAQALLDSDSRSWFQACALGCEGGGEDRDSPGGGAAPAQEEGEDAEGLRGSARGCYDLHLAPFYSSLCALFLVPLFSDHAGAEELASELL